MRRLKLGVGLCVFLGYFCTQATAQEIPEEARRAIAHNLQGPFVLLRDAMRDELKLSDEQKEKLDEYFREQLPDIMAFFQSLDGLDHDEKEPKLKAFRSKAQEKLSVVLKTTLKDDQLKRLHQVVLQQEGAFALLHGEPKIAKDLKVTDAQRKQFVAVMQELQKKVLPLIKEAESGGNHDEIRAKVMKIKKEQEDKIEALLTDAQKQQWKELLGKPLVIED
jgi:Spy/CpxP family protein refolding chaperone